MQPNHSTTIKKIGVKHVLAATGYSLSGARFLFQEQAARHEIILGAVSAALFGFAGVLPAYYPILGALFLLILCAEAMNTAGEEIINQISPEFSSFAKKSKDLLSFAVFCCLVIFIGFVLLVLASTLNILPG